MAQKTKSSSRVAKKPATAQVIKFNKLTLAIVVAVLAAGGLLFVLLTRAMPNNCQPENNVPICDVDIATNSEETVLSTNSWARDLGQNNGFWYWGAAFRAPDRAYNGAQPVYGVYNPKYSYRDFLFQAPAQEKMTTFAADGTRNEGIYFYAWPTQSQPGTVPVYKISRSGGSQILVTTDIGLRNKLITQDAGNDAGWKDKGVAFYAYPPTYRVAGQVNPGDCSVYENFVSDRCTEARNNLTGTTKPTPVSNTPVSRPATSTTPTPGAPPTTNSPSPSAPPSPTTTAAPPKPSAAPPVTDPKVTCDGNGSDGARVQIVYLRDNQTPDRYNTLKKEMMSSATRINGRVMASAQKTGGSRLVRWAHNANCEPTVLNVVIPKQYNGTPTDALMEFLQPETPGAQAYFNNDRKYLIFHDVGYKYCGLGGILVNPSAPYAQSFDNPNPAQNPYNLYNGVAIFSPECWGPVRAVGDEHAGDVQLHELWHALGAVNASAPHASYAKHCDDDQDTMCYDDRDTNAQPKTLQPGICPAAMSNFLLDCNNDDYFHTNPPPGSYLSSHWNTANSRYLIR